VQEFRSRASLRVVCVALRVCGGKLVCRGGCDRAPAHAGQSRTLTGRRVVSDNCRGDRRSSLWGTAGGRGCRYFERRPMTRWAGGETERDLRGRGHLIVGLVAAVVFAAFTSRPYTMATSFQSAWTDPSIVVAIVLGGARRPGPVVGWSCGYSGPSRRRRQ